MYKIKLKYILNSTRALFLFFPILGVLLFFDEKVNWNVVIIVSLIFALPSIYLFVEFLFYSLKTEILIDFLSKKIILNGTIFLKIDDIKSIEKICSYPLADNRRIWLLSDTFFYYKITFSNGEKIIITSFMCKTIFIDDKKLEIKRKFIPSIFFPL